MTKEEIKKVLPVIQAFSEGKVIQTKNGDETWITIGKETDLNIESLAEYPDCFRIKPEPNYRPFKNTEECWQEMLKHQPFGWVKNGAAQYINALSIGDDKNFSDWFKLYIFADGTPFGIKEN